MSELTPIEERRWNNGIRSNQSRLVVPIYRYEGYMRGVKLPRGSDARHIVLENRRRETKHGENVRLIQDRPFQ